MKRVCEWCGVSIITARSDAKFCSSQHRIYAHRAAKRSPIPRAMLERDRWMRYTAAKVPLTIDGSAASSTNPATWSSYADAARSNVGVGLGFALGDGIGCIDLDHCLVDGAPNEIAARFLETVPGHYIEVSPSGDGLHIWGTAEASVGSRQTIDGLHIERYSAGRYITVTGNVFQHGELLPL